MKHQQFYGPLNGKLAFQLPKGVTFTYDIRLGHLRDCWKGVVEEYNNKIVTITKPKKCRLVPQNGLESLGPKKSWKSYQTEIIVFDPNLYEEEIIHTKIWKKHRYTISLLTITEVKLLKL